MRQPSMILPSLLILPFLYVGIYVFAFLRRKAVELLPTSSLRR
jgi:hypothetical protein